MRAVHLVVSLAVLVVATLVYVFLDPGAEARRDRTETGPDTPAERTKTDTGEAPAAETGLVVTAVLELADRQAASDAAVELVGPRAARVRADESGSVRIAGLLPGAYTLLARRGDAALTHAFTLRASLDLGTLRLGSALLVRGHVRDGMGRAIAGALVEASPEKSVGATFRAFTRAPGSAAPTAARARSSADGSYELALPGAGEYALRAATKDHAPAFRAPEPFTATRDGVDFYLAAGVAVQGSVRTVDGTLLPGARVGVATWTRAGTRNLSLFTDARGAFSLVAEARSRLSFTVNAAGHALFTRANVRVPTPPLTFTLEAGVTVRFRAVAANTRAPAAGVAVILQYRGGHAEGATDERGEAVFEGQPSLGKAHARSDLYFVGDAYAPKRMSLRDREPDAGVLDLGDVELEAAGVVTGRVLVQGDRRPIQGAKVFVATQDWMSTALVNPTARTDARGAFRLEGVPIGAAVLIASHPDYVGVEDFSQLYARLRQHGESLFAKGERSAEHEILLVAAATMRGLVVDPAGDPVAGARVQRFTPTNPLDAMMDTLPRIVVTDAEGRFVLEGLRGNETFDLVATHSRHGASDRVALSAAQNTAPTLRLRRALVLTGRVVDPDGRAVANAHVQVNVPRSRTAGARPAPATTDEDGRFVVRDIPAGDLTVAIDHPSFRPFSEPVSVNADTPTTDVGALTLERGPRLAGIVVDDAGNPLAGVFVSAFLPGAARARPDQRKWTSTRTDGQGRFDLAGLADGEYQLKPRCDGWFGKQRTVRVNKTDVRLVMRRAATLRGRVVHDGVPVGGVRVDARVADDERLGATVTRSNGSFELAGLPPGDGFTVRLRHPSYETLRVDGARATNAEQEFTLVAGIQIGGTVVDDAGGPVGGVVVAVLAEDGTKQTGRSGKDGGFLLGGLPAGPLSLAIAWVPGRFLQPEPRAVKPGDRAVRITLAAGMTISGAITDAAGNAARNVIVQALRDGQIAGAVYVRGGAGTFEIGRLGPGPYAVRVVDGVTQRVLAEKTDVAGGAESVLFRITK